MIPSPHPADGTEAALVAPRSPARSGWREEVETGAGGGARQIEAKIGVGQGDGEAGEDALVDLGLAGADKAAQLLGAVARLLARAPLANGHERGEIVGGDEAGQAGGGKRTGRRRGLDGEQVPSDEDEERHGGAVIPAWHAHGSSLDRLHHPACPLVSPVSDARPQYPMMEPSPTTEAALPPHSRHRRRDALLRAGVLLTD